MNYLGHNEFGKNHMSWNIPKLYNNYNDVHYWLEQWFIFYDNVFYKYRNYKNCYFVNYDNLHNNNYIKQFIKILDLNTKPNFQFKINQKEVTDRFDKELYLNAEEFFQILQR